MKRALIVVDVQQDFCKGGTLEVPDGDAVVDVINGLIDKFDIVVATQDWHPVKHKSFASSHQGKNVFDTIDLKGIPQTLWPDHAIQNTEGAKFHEKLITDSVNAIIHKGMTLDVDSYSAFQDNDKKQFTGLGGYLQGHELDEAYICGLATDYCVKATALDYQDIIEHCGINTKIFVIADACRGVSPEGTLKAMEAMKAAGISIIKSQEVK